MKKYTWDIPFLIKRKNELLIFLNNNLTEAEKDKINFDIDNIDGMLENFSIMNNIDSYPYLFKTKKEITESITNLFNRTLTTFQKQYICEISRYFSDYETDYIDASIFTNKRIPLENQLDIITKNFSFNKTLLKENKNLFNPNNKRLLIFSTIDINNFGCFDNTGYIANQNKGSIEHFCCLCHELGHNHELVLTNNRIDYLYFIKNMNHLFLYREIYSIFYELLSSHFLFKEKIITKEEEISIHNNIFQDNTGRIDKFILAHIIKKEEDISIKEMLSFKVLNLTLDNIALYYYSYLIAVNLFEQFLIDEEKALYNLNYLINNITPENESKILGFIDANTNDLTKIIKHTKPFIQKKRNN